MTDLSQRIYATVKEEWNRQSKAYQQQNPHPNKADTLFAFKVLAAIVAENTRNHSLEVLTLGTGTKSIVDQTHAQSSDGTVLLDLHAEVIARRAFKRLLLGEVKTLQGNPRATGRFLDRVTFRGMMSPKYRLRDNLKLHLFISRAPCGAAQKPVNSKNADYLRTFTCESEADPIASKGARLDSREFYTCSDKLTLWAVVGLQGALLSRLGFEPIYFDSVTVRSEATGTGLEVERLRLAQALTGRLNRVCLGNGLFTLHTPLGYCLSKSDGTFYDVDFTGKSSDASSRSHNWIQSQGWEFTDSQNGKLHFSNDPKADATLKKASRLSKKALLGELPSSGPYRESYRQSYNALKQEATDYQFAKKSVREAFQALDLGIWAKRNAQFENFH